MDLLYSTYLIVTPQTTHLAEPCGEPPLRGLFGRYPVDRRQGTDWTLSLIAAPSLNVPWVYAACVVHWVWGEPLRSTGLNPSYAKCGPGTNSPRSVGLWRGWMLGLSLALRKLHIWEAGEMAQSVAAWCVSRKTEFGSLAPT